MATAQMQLQLKQKKVGVDRDDDGKRDERKAVVPDAALTKQEQLQEQREQRQTHLDTAATSGDHGNSNASRLFFPAWERGRDSCNNNEQRRR